MVVTGAGGMRKWGGIGQRVQSFGYTSSGDLQYSIVPTDNNIILYT